MYLNEFTNYIKNKKILIIGGGPNVSCRDKKWYDSFDIIVRLNNYKKVICGRTDIYFSYFGRNIRKTREQLISDGVKYLICKCPNADMTNAFLDNSITHVDMRDYRWIFDYRKQWWFAPLIVMTETELINQILSLNGYMPTTGMSAILFFLSRTDIPINVIGFDFFNSGLHNVDETWDNSGGHRPDLEEALIITYIQRNSIIWNS